MSWDFVIGTDHPDESRYTVYWNVSSGVGSWVLEQIYEGVTDEELKAELRPFVEGRYGYIPLGAFGEPQLEQIVAVILGPLSNAARREWPPDEDPFAVADHIEELIADTRDWLEAVNAHRRAEGRAELCPSPGPAPERTA
ncbi:hypothetical protein [Amycolatopsis sacchari]|uniref:hypothetical protein n=1 Tax=Amycolatopsis sacchari TaxID=115433 RepID=UPI003EBDE65B